MTTPINPQPMDPRPTGPQPLHPEAPTPQRATPPLGAQSDRPADVKNMSEAELKEDIERRRERLGETAEALTEKLDVKKQTQNAVQDAKHRAAEKAEATRARSEQAAYTVKDAATDERGKPKPMVLAAAALFAAGLVTVIVLSRRKK